MSAPGLTLIEGRAGSATNARPWREPIPSGREVAIPLLFQRGSFNAARLAELADRVAPLSPNQPRRSTGDVLRVLP